MPFALRPPKDVCGARDDHVFTFVSRRSYDDDFTINRNRRAEAVDTVAVRGCKPSFEHPF
jgi:hypothetical protein